MKEDTLGAAPPALEELDSLPWRYSLLLEFETLLFAIASTLDLGMTWRLLTFPCETGQAGFVESNPVARYFLYCWGFDGLVWFKLSLVVMIAVICQVIARRKIDVARNLLFFATLAVTAVVVYSAGLLAHAQALGSG